MTYYNFFDEYREEHTAASSGLPVKGIVTVVVMVAALCSGVYLFYFLKSARVLQSINYVQSIRQNEAFQKAYNESLEIKNASENIRDEMQIVDRLKAYELTANIANIELIDDLKNCFSDRVTIESVDVAGTQIKVEGQYEDQINLEESMLNLRTSGRYTNVNCDNVKSDDQYTGAVADEAEDETKTTYSFELSMTLIEETEAADGDSQDVDDAEEENTDATDAEGDGQ